MKHIFIMNPESGKVRSRRKIVTAIEQAACQLGADYEIYFTKGQGDGGAYAHALCEKYCKGFDGLERMQNAPVILTEHQRLPGCGSMAAAVMVPSTRWSMAALDMKVWKLVRSLWVLAMIT